jgi:hypothetical protein
MSFPKVFLLAVLVSAPVVARGQVFVVGEKTAMADLATDFPVTDLPLPSGRMGERGRWELIRDLDAEQGFAHRALPMGAGLTLEANGPLKENPEQYKRIVFEKGVSSAPGERVVITALEFKGDRLVIDLNGGPYAKHRFLNHLELNGMSTGNPDAPKATGSRITLVFKGGLPDVSAPEVKALLQPLIDFGSKTSVQAYADTLPVPVKKAIAQHDVLVGMDRKMVLAALGAPDSKIREHTADDPSQARYEEWIYGQMPKTIRFIRFTGDKVTQVKIAALGKPIELRDKDEIAALLGDQTPVQTHEIMVGDLKGPDDAQRKAPPTLRKEGEPEAATPNAQGKVLFPDAKPAVPAPIPPPPAPPSSPFMASVR